MPFDDDMDREIRLLTEKERALVEENRKLTRFGQRFGRLERAQNIALFAGVWWKVNVLTILFVFARSDASSALKYLIFYAVSIGPLILLVLDLVLYLKLRYILGVVMFLGACCWLMISVLSLLGM